jgi:hypothetical protein
MPAATARTRTKAPAAAVAVAAATLAIPPLAKGETYVGAIVGPDGKGSHVILLPGDKNRITWSQALEWAKGLGGDLPNRVEQALLFAHHRDAFERDWYWSNTQTPTTSAGPGTRPSASATSTTTTSTTSSELARSAEHPFNHSKGER